MTSQLSLFLRASALLTALQLGAVAQEPGFFSSTLVTPPAPAFFTAAPILDDTALSAAQYS